jgi:hypothetical protein
MFMHGPTRFIAKALAAFGFLAVLCQAAANDLADEKVKLICDLSIETVWGSGAKTERSQESVPVDVERVHHELFIEATGKTLVFAINTHTRTVEDRSDSTRWQMFDSTAGSERKVERQVTIDRNSGRFVYYLDEPVRHVSATGTCTKVDTEKRVF